MSYQPSEIVFAVTFPFVYSSILRDFGVRVAWILVGRTLKSRVSFDGNCQIGAPISEDLQGNCIRSRTRLEFGISCFRAQCSRTDAQSFFIGSEISHKNQIQAPPRAEVVKSLKNGILLNVLGMGAAILGMQATVGFLVAKALTTSIVPYYQGISHSNSPVLALDVFLVQKVLHQPVQTSTTSTSWLCNQQPPHSAASNLHTLNVSSFCNSRATANLPPLLAVLLHLHHLASPPSCILHLASRWLIDRV